MQLEDYFEFEKHETEIGPTERIRIKGHRISIEHVLAYYGQGVSPETICHDIYPGLDLEKVHATITYYLHNKEQVDDYIRGRKEVGEKFYQRYSTQPESEVVKRLRALKANPAAVSAPSAVNVSSEPAMP